MDWSRKTTGTPSARSSVIYRNTQEILLKPGVAGLEGDTIYVA